MNRLLRLFVWTLVAILAAAAFATIALRRAEPISALWIVTSWYPSILLTSAIIVSLWGYFLYAGVRDSLGGINSVWPLFGIANQLLAIVALCVSTTILIKSGKARYMAVALAPLIALVSVTFTAAYNKVLNPNPRIGFLAHAHQLATSTADGAWRLAFNDRLDALITATLVALVLLVVAGSVRV